MLGKNWIKRLMLPLEEYAIVDQNTSVWDALMTLDRAQASVPQGRAPHRAILVRNQKGDFVGKVGAHAVMRAMLPHRQQLFDHKWTRQSGLSDELVETTLHHMDMLEQDLPDLCERSRHMKVKDLVLTETAMIQLNSSLADVFRSFTEHHALSLLVTSGNEVIGILRLADVFDEITEYIKTCQPEPSDGEAPHA